MTVQEVLIDSLLRYPTIFKNKWSVYHHLFAVNGNGYEWKNGELVTNGEHANKLTTTEQGVMNQIEDRLSDSALLGTPLRHLRNSLKTNVSRILQIEESIKDFTPTEELYPLCEYAKIVNIPDDVKPDWKEATKEFYDYLISIYDTLSDNDKKYVDQITIFKE